MTEEGYITRVKNIISSSAQADAKIDEVSKLKLPKNAAPLLVLINGDSQEMQYQVKINDYEYDDLAEQTEADKQEIKNLVAPKIIEKLNQYLRDWAKGDKYAFSFELETLHTGLGYGSDSNVEYLHVRFPTEAVNIEEALHMAKELEEHLSERLIVYKNQKIGHKLDSVKPVYTIRNNRGSKVASGRLELDGFGASTWVNQH